jgi:hypothetical protein
MLFQSNGIEAALSSLASRFASFHETQFWRIGK